MATPKDSSAGPQRPATSKPVSEPDTSSAPRRLRQIDVPKGGPGQTWVDLTKDEVDKHMHADAHSKDKNKNKETGWSLAGMLRVALRRLIGRT